MNCCTYSNPRVSYHHQHISFRSVRQTTGDHHRSGACGGPGAAHARPAREPRAGRQLQLGLREGPVEELDGGSDGWEGLRAYGCDDKTGGRSGGARS